MSVEILSEPGEAWGGAVPNLVGLLEKLDAGRGWAGLSDLELEWLEKLLHDEWFMADARLEKRGIRPRRGALAAAEESAQGERRLLGSDVEIAFSMIGDDLVIGVKKGSWPVFRVLLKDALKPLDDDVLMQFSGISPDYSFGIGETKGRVLALARAVGLDPLQLAELEEQLGISRV